MWSRKSCENENCNKDIYPDTRVPVLESSPHRRPYYLTGGWQDDRGAHSCRTRAAIIAASTRQYTRRRIQIRDPSTVRMCMLRMMMMMNSRQIEGRSGLHGLIISSTIVERCLRRIFAGRGNMGCVMMSLREIVRMRINNWLRRTRLACPIGASSGSGGRGEVGNIATTT